jgi:hypothetical protein
LFVARTGVFFFKEYSSTRASGSDVELELSQVPQNTFQQSVVGKSLVRVAHDLDESDMS